MENSRGILWRFLFTAMVLIALSVSTPDSTTENIYKLKDYYVRRRYHRNDHKVPFAIQVLKIWNITVNSEPKDVDEILNFFGDFLKDLQNKTIIKECGSLQITEHYSDLSDKLIAAKVQDAETIFTDFFEELSMDFDYVKPTEKYYKIFHNDALRKQIYKVMKFSPVCCKFWNATEYVEQIIDGKC